MVYDRVVATTQPRPRRCAAARDDSHEQFRQAQGGWACETVKQCAAPHSLHTHSDSRVPPTGQRRTAVRVRHHAPYEVVVASAERRRAGGEAYSHHGGAVTVRGGTRANHRAQPRDARLAQHPDARQRPGAPLHLANVFPSPCTFFATRWSFYSAFNGVWSPIRRDDRRNRRLGLTLTVEPVGARLESGAFVESVTGECGPQPGRGGTPNVLTRYASQPFPSEFWRVLSPPRRASVARRIRWTHDVHARPVHRTDPTARFTAAGRGGSPLYRDRLRTEKVAFALGVYRRASRGALRVCGRVSGLCFRRGSRSMLRSQPRVTRMARGRPTRGDCVRRHAAIRPRSSGYTRTLNVVPH